MLIANIGIWSRKNALRKMKKQQMLEITEKMSDVTAQDALKNLSSYLNLLYGKKSFDLSG